MVVDYYWYLAKARKKMVEMRGIEPLSEKDRLSMYYRYSILMV